MSVVRKAAIYVFLGACAALIAFVALLEVRPQTHERRPETGTIERPSTEQDDLRVTRAVEQARRFPITGLVQADDGKTLADAFVCLAPEPLGLNLRPSCIRTGADGRFAFHADATATHVLSAAAPLHVPTQHAVGQADFRSHPEGIELVLRLKAGGAVVAGSVLDASGGVIPGARVLVRSNADSAFLTAAETDAEGHFRMFVPPGNVDLSAEAEGFSRTIVDVVAPNERVKIALSAGARISGQVVHLDTQRPVRDVGLVATKRGGLMVGYGSAKSNDQGEFVITGLAPGDYEVAVSDASWVGEPKSATVAIGETTEGVVLAVSKGAAMYGEVRVNGGACSEGAVTLHSNRDFGAVTAPNGIFRFQSIPPGDYVAEASCRGALSATRKVSVRAGENAPQQWDLSAGLSIAGRVVTRSGKAHAGIVVRAEYVEDAAPAKARNDGKPPASVTCETDVAGAFECRGLRSGSYRCTATNGELALGDAVTVSLAERSVDSLELRIRDNGSIRAQVTGTNGQTVSGTRVFARTENDYLLQASRRSDGDYVFPNLPVGKYRVFAGNERNENRAMVAAIDRDGEDTFVKIALALNGSLRGRVLDDDGSPVPDAWVSAEDTQAISSMARDGRAPSLTDVRGEFEITGLEAGTYRLRVEAPNGEATVEEVSTGTPVNVRLHSYAVVLGRVRSASGAAIPNFSLSYRRDFTVNSASFDNSDGSFRLRRLLPGKWTFSVSSPQGAATREIEVKPSQRTEVTLTVDAAMQVDPRVEYGALAQPPGSGS